jgi:hypothetical protein
MKRVSNPVKSKVRDRILAVINRLYDQNGRCEEPAVDTVSQLAGAGLAACDEVIREWRGHLPSAASETDVAPNSEWVRKISDLAARRKVVNRHLAAAVAVWRAEAAATDQCVSEITAAYTVQAKELRTERTKLAGLESRTTKAEAAAAVAQREAGEAKSQLEMMTKEAARALAYVCKVERLADDLKAAWSAAGASVQTLFAEIELERSGRRICCAGQEEIVTSDSFAERTGRLQTASAKLAATATCLIDAAHEIPVSTEPTEVIAITDETNTSWYDNGDTPGSCQECVCEAQPKTREEVDRLKRDWDGDWEIEHTEGFSAHYAELLAFSLERKAFWAERQAAAEAHARKRLEEYAAELGIRGNTALAQVLNRLVGEIKTLGRENCELVDRMNHVEARLDGLK